jgi:hypothetical protein
MKKFIILPMIALLAIPAFAADSTQTTTTKTYDSSTTTPMSDTSVQSPDMGIQSEEERSYDSDALTSDELEQERMEERRDYDQRMDEMDSNKRMSSDGIDYTDRTRTNRERKALNTGSNASDDQ